MSEHEFRKKIVELFNKGIDSHFTGGVGHNKILDVENTLNVTLPESYKWFLREYGHGGMVGVEILGVGLSSVPPVVEFTLRYRKLGLPNSFVVISNVDEWVYCLETSKMKNGECPVIDWDRKGESYYYFDNFYLFLINQLESAIEDLC